MPGITTEQLKARLRSTIDQHDAREAERSNHDCPMQELIFEAQAFADTSKVCAASAIFQFAGEHGAKGVVFIAYAIDRALAQVILDRLEAGETIEP